MTRPTRNVVALVAIDIEGMVPGVDETINDAVARYVADVLPGNMTVEAVYTDGEGFLDDFWAGDVPHPGIYEDDPPGTITPPEHTPTDVAEVEAEQSEDHYPRLSPPLDIRPLPEGVDPLTDRIYRRIEAYNQREMDRYDAWKRSQE